MVQSGCFRYQRQVAFCDTDAMGVVHHSYYLKFCEEARVEWILKSGMGAFHWPQSPNTLAVTETRVKHLAPLRFPEVFFVDLNVQPLKSRLRIQYRLTKKETNQEVALAETWLVWVGEDLKVKKPDRQFVQFVEQASEGFSDWL